MSAELTGLTALITGSTSGIGRATAVTLAERGAHVLVSGRDAERGEAAVAQIPPPAARPTSSPPI